MRFPASPALVLAALGVPVQDLLPAQDPPRTRILEEGGMGFTLPAGWEWKDPAGTGIAAKAGYQSGERSGTVFAEMKVHSRRFVSQLVDGIDSHVKKNPQFLKDLRVEDHQNLFGSPDAASATYVEMQQGSAPLLHRLSLFRRGGHLFEWHETHPVDAEPPATLLAAARGAIKPGKPDTGDVERDYVLQRVKYRLPEGWVWQEGAPGPKVSVKPPDRKSALLFRIATDVLQKPDRTFVGVDLSAVEGQGAPGDLANFNKTQWREDHREFHGLEVEDKVTFRGERAVRVSFRGKNKEAGNETLYHHRYTIFRHRNHGYFWHEVTVAGREAKGVKACDAAAKGFNSY